jgi:3-oxoacyl-[acyl-carrier protein] reductase
MFALDSKVALVTGGSRGIGRSICATLAKAGAHVYVNYAKNEAQANEVVGAIEAEGGKATPIGFDVSNVAAGDAAIAAIVAKHGRLDILVSNAGIVKDQLLIRMKDDQLEQVLAVNLKGPIALARSGIRAMMKSKFGRLIFISSVVGEMGNAGQTAYSASKAALLGVTKTLAREYASRSITVNAITPGFIETDMTSALPDAQKKALSDQTPVGRLGHPEDIAAATLYLASTEASFVTGQVLRVNGGLYM